MRLPPPPAARPSLRRSSPWGAWALGLGMVALGVPSTLAADAPGTPALRAGNPRRTPIVEIVEKVKDAVVNIHSERTVAPHGEDLFALNATPNRVNGMGTG